MHILHIHCNYLINKDFNDQQQIELRVSGAEKAILG